MSLKRRCLLAACAQAPCVPGTPPHPGTAEADPDPIQSQPRTCAPCSLYNGHRASEGAFQAVLKQKWPLVEVSIALAAIKFIAYI